jgi:hypothetical protein
MPLQNAPRLARPVAPAANSDRRAVRLPVGADSKLFGGWGVRF